MNQPKISILMSVYKESEDKIVIAVESILQQSFSDFELIIVNDNPGSEETSKILQKLSQNDARIKILKNEQNRGLGYSLNKALKHANANTVARMDTEDTSEKERLQKQFAFMQATPNVDLLFTQWIDVDERGKETPRSPTREDYSKLSKTFFTKSLILHPTLMAKRQVLLENPYPEMERPEDLVLFLKLIRKGYAFDVIEEPLYKYKRDTLDLQKRYKKIRRYSRNLLPHLLRESSHYLFNPYFWIYFFRITSEYIVSRNFLVFKFVHAFLARIWKTFFGA